MSDPKKARGDGSDSEGVKGEDEQPKARAFSGTLVSRFHGSSGSTDEAGKHGATSHHSVVSVDYARCRRSQAKGESTILCESRERRVEI